MVYFCSFLISSFFINLGTKKNKFRYFSIGIVVGLLIPILLAAFRDISVGGDVSYYVVPYFKHACNSVNFTAYLSNTRSGDLLYDILNFVVSRFTNDFFWLFLCQETIIIIFVYLGLVNYSEIVKPWISMLMFYFLFYQFTLTTVRQSLALSICFYGISIAVYKRFTIQAIKKSIIWSIVAVLFHKTAIFSVVLLLIMKLVTDRKMDIKKYFIPFTISSFIICLAFKTIIPLVMNLFALLNPKYVADFYKQTDGIGASGYKTLILLAAVTDVILLIVLRKMNNNYYWKLIDTSIIYFTVFAFLSLLLIDGFKLVTRMFYYIEFFWFISIPQICILFRKDRVNQMLGYLGCVLLGAAFWWYYFIYGGVTMTYPYVLGIG